MNLKYTKFDKLMYGTGIVFYGVVIAAVLYIIRINNTASNAYMTGFLAIATVGLALTTFGGNRQNSHNAHLRREMENIQRSIDEYYGPLLGYFLSNPILNGFEIREILLTKAHLRIGTVSNPLFEGGEIVSSAGSSLVEKSGYPIFCEPKNKDLWIQFRKDLWSEYLVLIGKLMDEGEKIVTPVEPSFAELQPIKKV